MSISPEGEGLETLEQEEKVLTDSDHVKHMATKAVAEENKNDLKRLLCCQSLYNISMDLEDLEPLISNLCLILAKQLAEKDMEMPNGIIHTSTTSHNTNVTEEIAAVLEEIKNGKSI
jgi:hypothetical protein